MSNVQDLLIETRDGRMLKGFTSAISSRNLLIYCHGTPFPAVPWEHLESQARARNLKVVAWARPGYGGSTPQPGRSVRSFSEDAEDVVASLGGDHAIALGWSGGGPHALSLGVGPRAHCRAIITIGSVAPYGLDDLDWTAGMGQENIDEFALAVQGGDAFTEFLETVVPTLGDATTEGLIESMATLISPVDAEALSEHGLAELFVHGGKLASAYGIEGWRDDDGAFLKDWGFSPSEITVPVSLWQGVQDLMVPGTHGSWLANAIPGVSAHLLEGEGHLSLATRYLGAMLDEACERGGL